MKKTNMPTITTSFNTIMAACLSHCTKWDKKNKENEKRKKQNCYYSHWVIYIECSPPKPTDGLLEIIREFSKASGYKTSRWKSVLFLYTNHKSKTYF